MTNTWTPIPGAIVFDPEKGQRYVYRNGRWIPVPEWMEEPSPLDCPACDGVGWYARQVDDAGNAEQEQCRDCDGKGMVTNSVTGEPDDCYTCDGSGVEERWQPLDDGTHKIDRWNEIEIWKENGTDTIGTFCADMPMSVILPAGVRLCRRVPDEPITPDALRREGWKDTEEDECVLVKRIDDDLTCYFWNDLEGKEHFEVVYAAVIYPGVHTMQDLLILTQFLEGTMP